MEDIFKPESLSIKNLFSSPDSLFEVPIYQRPYSWGEEEVEQLWDDLYTAWIEQEENQNYFLGSIITISKDNSYQDIVDGQQRLTTLMILFCVIRDIYPKINSKIDINKYPGVIRINRIKGFICDTDDRKRLKLFTHASHQNDFETCILKEGATNKTQQKNRDQGHVRDRFIQVSDFFREKLCEMGEEETGKLLNYIGNHVKMIKITCKDRSFAIKLFQVLNDRGKNLEPSDLIKSALISRLPENKHKQFIADWDKANNIIESFDCDTNIDDMFTLYVYYNLASNPKRNNYEEVEGFSKNKDSNEVINDFKNFCSLYEKHISNSNNKIINSLWYLRWKYHWKAVMITALKHDFSEYKELLFELRRFYYLNWIAGKTVNTIKQASFNLIKFIKEGKPLSFIKEELNKKLEEDNIFQLILSNLKSNSAKPRWIRPVLMMIEYNQTDNEDKDFIPLNSKIHLEHVLPIQYKKISGWEHIEEDTANNYLNSIGNLTLLGGSKNVSASNNPFKTKLNIYNGKGKYNNSKKGVTRFMISQKIAQDVNEGNIEKWDKNAMEKRWNWFLNELKDLLQVDVSSILINDKNKIEDIKKQKPADNFKKKIIKIDKKMRREKNKEFFNQFLDEMKKEHPDFYLKHSVNNAIHATPSKSFSKITVFRAVDNPRVGIFWQAKEKEEDWKLFELMKADPEFPKSFKIYEETKEQEGEILTSAQLSIILNFNDIYDPATYLKQKEFLKTNLVLIYNYMSQKMLELKKKAS